MKTLYISDLDGTLLNQNAEISEYTAEALNKLIKSGMHFSVATARTSATAVLMLKEVPINIPIVLMNGVLIYDIMNKKFIKKEPLDKPCAEQIICVMNEAGMTGFLYTLKGNEPETYYTTLSNNAMKSFARERLEKFGKKFTKIDDFTKINEEIIYFCYMDDFENIHRLYDKMAKISGLRIEKYQDIYSNDLWYMEVFSEKASKYNAVKFLREKYGFDRVVSFGDNLNDLPMFKASDECYAVANAKPELKAAATAVIESNENDGVARFIEGEING